MELLLKKCKEAQIGPTEFKSDDGATPMEFKTLPAYGLKVIDEDKGIVEHLISVFGVVDLVRDISHPGMFTKTLAERGSKIRVLDTHRRDSILRVIGVPLELKEIPREELPSKLLEEHPEATGGLWASTQFLLDTPEGRGAFLRFKSNAVSEFSFGYDTLDSDETKGPDGKTVRNLRTVRLWEYSPVAFGANPAAAAVGVKSILPSSDDSKVVDVRENTIRIRVRASGDFEKGSFRTINIGAKDNGIQAVIGRLKGETTTTIQAYIFDKDKWTSAEAQAWVKKHGEKKTLSITERLSAIERAFHTIHNPAQGPYHYWIKEVFDEYLIVEAVEGLRKYYKVAYKFLDADAGSVEFSPRSSWILGDFVFIEHKPDSSTQGAKEQVLILDIEMEQSDIELAI